MDREMTREEAIEHLGQPRAVLPEHLVRIKTIIQLRDGGGNWSSTEEADDLREKIDTARGGSGWVDVELLVRRPTGKGEVAMCYLDANSPYILIETDDYIDPINHRPVEPPAER